MFDVKKWKTGETFAPNDILQSRETNERSISYISHGFCGARLGGRVGTTERKVIGRLLMIHAQRASQDNEKWANKEEKPLGQH